MGAKSATQQIWTATRWFSAGTRSNAGRELAARMLALGLDAKDQQLLERLCVRASEYLDQAGVLDATQPPATDAKKKN